MQLDCNLRSGSRWNPQFPEVIFGISARQSFWLIVFLSSSSLHLNWLYFVLFLPAFGLKILFPDWQLGLHFENKIEKNTNIYFQKLIRQTNVHFWDCIWVKSFAKIGNRYTALAATVHFSSNMESNHLEKILINSAVSIFYLCIYAHKSTF